MTNWSVVKLFQSPRKESCYSHASWRDLLGRSYFASLNQCFQRLWGNCTALAAARRKPKGIVSCQEQGWMLPQVTHKERCNAIFIIVAWCCICPQHYLQNVSKGKIVRQLTSMGVWRMFFQCWSIITEPVMDHTLQRWSLVSSGIQPQVALCSFQGLANLLTTLEDNLKKDLLTRTQG